MTKRPDMLVVSWMLPPHASGSTRLLHNLLHWLAPDEAILLGSRPPVRAPKTNEPCLQESHLVPAIPPNVRGERFLRFLTVPIAVARGLELARRHQPRSLLVVFPDESWLLTGYLLHRLTRLPLHLYFHDLYAENRDERILGSLAAWLQPRVLRRARHLFVANPGMAHHFAQEYGIDATVLGCSTIYPVPDEPPAPTLRAPMQLGYSGNVYDNVADRMRAMASALGDGDGARMKLFTPATEATLRQLGAWNGDAMTLDFANTTRALIDGLQACDALYLPLCFDLPPGLSARELETAFPIKSLEYLAAGRPIIVHCPEHYYLASFFRDRDAALLVHDPSPAALRAALRTLAGDPALRHRLASNALAAARELRGDRLVDALRRQMRASACA